MRFYVLLLLFVSINQSSCQVSTVQRNPNLVLRFLYKVKSDGNSSDTGYHLRVKKDFPKTDEMVLTSIDDRDIISRSGYSREDKIEILGEYLSFRGDTTTSTKKYQFKPAYALTAPEDRNGFTVQIEALYSFTRMLTYDYPPIKPTLINRLTGKKLNTNVEVISEVFDIYTDWYLKSKKSNFQDITPPLSETQYSWLGEDQGMAHFWKKSL